MRMIGKFPQKLAAERLADLLAAHDIQAVVETSQTEWTVWVRDENQVATSRRLSEAFSANSEDPALIKLEHQGRKLRLEHAKQKQAAAQKPKPSQVVVMRDRWRRPDAKRAPVTSLLLVLCIGVSLLTGLGETSGLFESPQSFGEQLLSSLLIVDAPSYLKQNSDHLGSLDMDSLEFRTWSLRRGEIWRLWTPALIHFGVVHLVFNMYAMFRLGTILESVLGSRIYLMFVLIAAAVSNIGCFVPSEGSGFLSGGGWLAGGMSGVLYAIFGLALMRDRLTGRFPLMLAPSTVFMLLFWLALGFLGVLDDPERGTRISNWAHGTGIAFGLAVGFAAYRPTQSRRR